MVLNNGAGKNREVQMEQIKRPDVLGRSQRTGRKGVLGKPTISRRAREIRNQRHINGTEYAEDISYARRYADRYYRSPAFFLKSMFTGRGRYPKLITIVLFIILIYLLFTKLILTKGP